MTLAEAIARFLDDRRRLGRSKSAISSQRRALEGLLCLLEHGGRRLVSEAVTEDDLWAFLEAERARGLSPATLQIQASGTSARPSRSSRPSRPWSARR